MELPHDYQKKFHSDSAAKKPRSEWEEQLDVFAAKLNPGRIAAGYKPYSNSRIGKLLKNYGVSDAASAHRFYGKVETEGRNFGKLFDYLTSPKKA